MRTPDKPPTRGEWLVMGVSAAVLLAGPGLVALGFAWLKPPADPGELRTLLECGACLVGLGSIFAGAVWWFTR